MSRGYKAKYDYVELTVEQQEDHWRLRLRDMKHCEDIMHEDEFTTAAEAQDAAMALAQDHINLQHNDTLMLPARLSWHEF